MAFYAYIIIVRKGDKFTFVEILLNRYLQKEMIMNYETRPCVEDDEEFIEEMEIWEEDDDE